jgi:penicillin-binding protein 1A
MLETVLQYGTGRAAALGQFAAGKTGTTSNYGDAWFVGWNSKYTVAVWVGYPDKLIPMTTDFNGHPVLGGTFPALIWHEFMTAAIAIDQARGERRAAGKEAEGSGGEEGTTSSSSIGQGQGGAPTSGAGAGKSSAPSTGAEKRATPPVEHAATPEKAAPAPSGETPSAAPTPATPPSSTSPSPTGGVGPSG